MRPLSYLWGITRLSSDGHVIVEDNHKEIPVAIDKVPKDPANGISPKDEWQEADVHYAHH